MKKYALAFAALMVSLSATTGCIVRTHGHARTARYDRYDHHHHHDRYDRRGYRY
jgi:hypothetical protein